MNKDEAIQQAIDFLDGSYEAHAVRKALQEALAPPAQNSFREVSLTDAPSIYTNEQGQAWANGYNDALEALAQPAQEPVAWMNDIAFSMDKELLGTRSRIVPLYTHPAPAKEWVGLSEDEIEYWECLKAPPVHPDFVDDDSWRNFAKAIEQVLKEKNNGTDVG